MQVNSSHSPIFVSVHQACDATGLGRTTVYDLINKGVLKSIRVGKRRLVLAASIRDLASQFAAS